MQYKLDASFNKCLPYVLSVEGGYVNNPNDPGGPTKYGIAYNFNKTALHQLGISNPEQMKALSKEQATEIYYINYWVAAQCHQVSDLKLQLVHFDTCVNHGVGRSLDYLTKLNLLSKMDSDACWRALVRYFALREKAYTSDKNRKYFLAGWVNRLAKLKEVVVIL